MRLVGLDVSGLESGGACCSKRPHIRSYSRPITSICGQAQTLSALRPWEILWAARHVLDQEPAWQRWGPRRFFLPEEAEHAPEPVRFAERRSGLLGQPKQLPRLASDSCGATRLVPVTYECTSVICFRRCRVHEHAGNKHPNESDDEVVTWLRFAASPFSEPHPQQSVDVISAVFSVQQRLPPSVA